ncbi:MAG: DUF2480 family protein [candidate division Zixibacteria bacterium]|nr:DUF2480 family protein [candidate division Zixibacteria bacterium]
MPRFDFDSYAEGGIIRESTVREAFAKIDWETYRDKTVHIQGCSAVVIPTWAYLMAAAHLALVARKITFGEDSSPMPIYSRPEAG